jgi:CheY-like chemotaxis protein
VSPVVLYIEDDPDNVRLVERLLRRLGRAELRTAATGAEGVRAAAAARPALILLDNRLPDATGSEVLGQLTADPATAAIPVVVVSGDSGARAAASLRAAGAAGFLAKPFDIREFEAMIRGYLSDGPPA